MRCMCHLCEQKNVFNECLKMLSGRSAARKCSGREFQTRRVEEEEEEEEEEEQQQQQQQRQQQQQQQHDDDDDDPK